MDYLKNAFFITTSWDDGHPLDFEIAGLLKKFDLKGTFYVPLRNTEHELMDTSEMIELSKLFEIGAHTVSHNPLSSIPLHLAAKEITESKKRLESLIGKEVRMFCYPRGIYNNAIIEFVKHSGFCGARTIEQFSLDLPSDPFKLGTSVHFTPQTFRKYVSHILKLKHITKLKLIRRIHKNPFLCAKDIFEYFLIHGEVFHIWGHSWEIDHYNLWDDLEKTFSTISGRADMVYCSNSELVTNLTPGGKK